VISGVAHHADAQPPKPTAASTQYYGTRTGPLTIGASLGGAYLDIRPDLEAPDLHLHFLPFMPDDAGWGLAKFSGFRLGMGADLVKAG
jgi:choline dehydrogenase